MIHYTSGGEGNGLTLYNQTGYDAKIPTLPTHENFLVRGRQKRPTAVPRHQNKGDATCLLHGRNEAHAVPFANLQIARAYLMAADSKAPTRTWGNVFEEIFKLKPKWWCRPSPPTNRNRRPTSIAKSVSRALCLRFPVQYPSSAVAFTS